MKIKVALTLFLLFGLYKVHYAQISLYMSASSGLTFGYTFGKGWNASIYANFGFVRQVINNKNLVHGVNVSYTLFTHKSELYQSNLYRVVSLNYVCNYDNLAQLKLGSAKSKLKWGLNNRNSKKTVWGLNLQAEAMPFQNGALVGFRYFKLNDQCMGIGGKEPKLLYVRYQYNFLNSSSKQINK